MEILIQKLLDNGVKLEDIDSNSTISSLINGINITFLYVTQKLRKDDFLSWQPNEINTLNRKINNINNILSNGSYSHYLNSKYSNKKI